jgi:SPP1 family predicted phage head-tail adaptor
MRAGSRRHIGVFQQTAPSSPEADTFGASAALWVDFAPETHVEIEPLTGTELFRAQQVNPEIEFRIRMLYRAGVEPEMRFVHGGDGGDVYEVVSVVDVDLRHRNLELLCKRVRDATASLTSISAEPGGFVMSEDGFGINDEGAALAPIAAVLAEDGSYLLSEDRYALLQET